MGSPINVRPPNRSFLRSSKLLSSRVGKLTSLRSVDVRSYSLRSSIINCPNERRCARPRRSSSRKRKLARSSKLYPSHHLLGVSFFSLFSYPVGLTVRVLDFSLSVQRLFFFNKKKARKGRGLDRFEYVMGLGSVQKIYIPLHKISSVHIIPPSDHLTKCL